VTRRIRTYADVGGAGGGDILAQVGAQLERLADRLAHVGSIVAIGSGKGGVGKSLVTANVAAGLVRRGHRVGVLDADLNGPSAALMLGAERGPLTVTEHGVRPAATRTGCVVMSMDLLLATKDAPVRWREPPDGGFVWQSTLETGALREFLADTEWGELDYLLVDLPPGTDRIARFLTLVRDPAALLLVTTPSAAAGAVVARSVTQARAAGVRNVGLVSNMDGHVCGHCGETTPLFTADAGAALADRTGVPVWATIPFDAALCSSTDAGGPFTIDGSQSIAARELENLVAKLDGHVQGQADERAREVAR
jgi:ATP-binding protein involved in chromosome partitioning